MAIRFEVRRDPVLSKVEIIKDDDEVVGYLTFTEAGDDGILVREFWVHEDYRTVGNARKLVKRFVKRFRHFFPDDLSDREFLEDGTFRIGNIRTSLIPDANRNIVTTAIDEVAQEEQQ